MLLLFFLLLSEWLCVQGQQQSFCSLKSAAGCEGGLQELIARKGGSLNPMDGINVGQWSCPALQDLDDDGDFDLMIGVNVGTFKYYENTGNSNNPMFTARTGTLNPMNGIDIGSYASPELKDLDGDGDFDMIVGEKTTKIKYFENTGDSINMEFTERTGVSNPMGSISFDGQRASPALEDLDADGDFDMVVGNNIGQLQYYENTGSATNAVFTKRTGVLNPMNGIYVVGTESRPALKDLDGDGDFDMFLGNYAGQIQYFENTGGATNPAYTARSENLNPMDGVDVSADPSSPGAAWPTLEDLDGDGDFEMVVGSYSGEIHYFDNAASSKNLVYTDRTGILNPMESIGDIGSSASPELGDLDGDGDLDMVIGERNGKFIYYENTGSITSPTFTSGSYVGGYWDSTFDVGTWASPGLGDVDGDGDLDMFSGNQYGQIRYFENTGSPTILKLTSRTGNLNPMDGVDLGVFSSPVLEDLDDDGDLDMIVGAGNEKTSLNPGDSRYSVSGIFYFENTGTTTSPVYTARTGLSNPMMNENNIDIDTFPKPSLKDLDGDGDFDMIVGNVGGQIEYFENTGNVTNPMYKERYGSLNPMNGISVGAMAKPALEDLDGDGDIDLLVGNQDGNIKYFEAQVCQKQPTCSGSGSCRPPSSDDLSPMYTCDCGGAWAGSHCQMCPLGSVTSLFLGGGSMLLPQSPPCLDCEKGKFSNILGFLKDASCQNCPAGYFVDTERASECKVCPEGFKQPHTGKTTCKQCLPGYYNGNKADTPCLKCVIGQYRGDSGNSSVCNDCPKGFYQDTEGQTICLGCRPGKYQDDVTQKQCKLCSKNTAASDTQRSKPCDKCIVGRYAEEGSLKCTPSTAVMCLRDSSTTCKGTPTQYVEVDNVTWGIPPIQTTWTGNGIVLSVFGDTDGDGDQDMIALVCDGSFVDWSVDICLAKLIFYENIAGSAPGTAPLWQERPSDYAGANISSIPLRHTWYPDKSQVASFMSFVDLDGDGDLDFMIKISDYKKSHYYAENIGSPTRAEWVVAPSPLGKLERHCSACSTVQFSLSFADMDDDGDLDLVRVAGNEQNWAEYYYADLEGLRYFENIGNRTF